MNRWKAFTPEELEKISAQGLSITEVNLMICPHCGGRSMRVYVHDLQENITKTAEWIWCKNCKRVVHHRIAALYDKYQYDDPLDSGVRRETLSLVGDKWYDFLNGLYDSGILPQKIVEKSQGRK